jgi:replicative DNA helicase
VTAAYDAALTYADRGWHVAPIEPGKKYPRFNDWPNLATTNPDTINQWWNQQWPTDGIGIACGPKSGIFVIDIDVNDGKQGAQTLAQLEALHGELPETYTVRTPTGGWHYYYRWDPNRPVNNGTLGLHIDTRGDGGQVVAPPTLHPDTHTAYQVHLDIEPADAPDWVYDILLTKPEPAKAVTHTTAPGSTDDPGPASEYNQRHTWDQLLTADGWTLHHVDHSGESHWTRPGKDTREGTSATTNYQGRDCLKVFTSSVPGLDADAAYSRFGYYAATRHHGDRSAAARQLLDDGYKPDLVGWINDTPTPHIVTPAALNPHTGEIVIDEHWEEPTPLGMATRTLPTFPIHTLPEWLANQITAVADDIQVPIDLPATIALAALASVTAKRIYVQADGWTTTTNLYLVVASPPGQGKSPVFAAMTACLEQLQADIAAAMAPEIAKAELTRRISEKQSKKAEEKGDIDTAWIHYQAAMDVDIPKPPRLIADDATPEALTSLLASNQARMAIMSSEGGVFDLMTGKYSDRANLEVYLKAWSGDTIQVDRVNREPEYVQKPALTIGLTVQPMVIRRLANKPELAGRGLTARFMYSLPPSNVGHRDMTRRRTDRKHQQTIYDAALINLHTQLANYITPGTISLNEHDVTRFYNWRDHIEKRRAEGKDLHPMAEWSTKLEASVLRLAGILHLADGGAHHGTINNGVLDRCLEIADYWIEHAFAVHDLWGTDDSLASARIILAWAHRENITTFTGSDVQKKLRSQFKRIADVVDPIALLVERGWVRPLFDGPLKVGQRGAPAKRFAVHPTAQPVDKHTGTGAIVREWCTTSSQSPKVVSHSRHLSKDLNGQITHSLSTPPDGAPHANGANETQPVSNTPNPPVENEQPYNAIIPTPEPDLDGLI